MGAVVHASDELERALSELDRGLVFAPRAVGEDWDEIEAELVEAFRLTKQALAAGTPVTYVVEHDDLLGRRGAGRAMVATGLLSAARSAAFEARRDGVPVNVLATDADHDPGRVAEWITRLMERAGPTGELIRLTTDHLGKALP